MIPRIPSLSGDAELFERLILEINQAGLSWLTILKKRDAFRSAYRGFDPEVVARFGARDVTRLMRDAGIIRNRLKVEAAIANGSAACPAEGHGSFAGWLDAHHFVGATAQRRKGATRQRTKAEWVALFKQTFGLPAVRSSASSCRRGTCPERTGNRARRTPGSSAGSRPGFEPDHAHDREPRLALRRFSCRRRMYRSASVSRNPPARKASFHCLGTAAPAARRSSASSGVTLLWSWARARHPDIESYPIALDPDDERLPFERVRIVLGSERRPGGFPSEAPRSHHEPLRRVLVVRADLIDSILRRFQIPVVEHDHQNEQAGELPGAERTLSPDHTPTFFRSVSSALKRPPSSTDRRPGPSSGAADNGTWAGDAPPDDSRHPRFRCRPRGQS